MSVISPFSAIRYNPERAGLLRCLCCPPYDVISSAEQAAIEEENPYNIIRLEKPQGEDRYRRAGETLRQWLSEDILRQDKTPAYYLYRLDFTDRGAPLSVYGFFARVKVEPFESGVILPHEETLSKDKSDRLNLMRETFCNISPIYSLYEDAAGVVDALLQTQMSGAPDETFTDAQDVTHSMWVLTDPARIALLTGAMASKRLLIADGHHRYETALAFWQEQREKQPALSEDDPMGSVLMMLVEMNNPGLVVWPTHRLVRDVSGFSVAALLAALAADFQLSECPVADDVVTLIERTPNTVGLYAGGDRVTLLTCRSSDTAKQALPGKSAAYCSLEVSLLHALILEPHLGIDKEQLAAQTHLTYTRSLREAIDGVRDKTYQCAFLLPSTPVPMIGQVADAGERMPQKSTYFYPKLTTGLVVHPLREF